jgi:hypothetical protein
MEPEVFVQPRIPSASGLLPNRAISSSRTAAHRDVVTLAFSSILDWIRPAVTGDMDLF